MSYTTNNTSELESVVKINILLTTFTALLSMTDQTYLGSEEGDICSPTNFSAVGRKGG